MSNFANPELTNNFRQIVLASNTPSSPAIVFANDLTVGLYWDINGVHLTGLSATPADNTEAASKAYVDAQSGGGSFPLLAPSGQSPVQYSFTDSPTVGMAWDNGLDQLFITNPFGQVNIITNGNGIYAGTGEDLFLGPNAGTGTLLQIGNSPSNVTFTMEPSTTFTVVTNPSSQNSFQIDSSTTAHDTRCLLWDVDKGTLSRVSVGAADSGGTGFKLLRVPN